MSTKIRLARRGRKRLAIYDIVVADSRAPRDGKFIEKLGTYNPNIDPAAIVLDEEKAFDWVMKGAQPTDTARSILSKRGVMIRKHLQLGVIKGAVKQEDADKKYEAWLKDKDASTAALVGDIKKKQDAEAKAKLDAEIKKREEADKALAEQEAAALAAAEAEAKAQEEAAAAEAATEEPAAEATEEAPKAEETAEEPKAEAAEKAE
ncbi:MAG: 30S ribosomal protein S16 [Cyclobacteriaceae bacterium]